MGDRCNIAVLPEWGAKAEGPQGVVAPVPVVLYGHWSGDSYVEDTRRALAKRWRWNDDSYLTRIVYDQFVGDQAGTETSFGITAGSLSDNEHPILHVNVRTQRVSLHHDLVWDPPAEAGVSFEDFANGATPEVE